ARDVRDVDLVGHAVGRFHDVERAPIGFVDGLCWTTADHVVRERDAIDLAAEVARDAGEPVRIHDQMRRSLARCERLHELDRRGFALRRCARPRTPPMATEPERADGPHARAVRARAPTAAPSWPRAKS